MKFIRINMKDKTIREEEVPESYQGLGGRGLTSVMIHSEVPPNCNPLGPENKLIFAPGLFSGTSLVNTSRISVGAKSPLTGTIKESNAGGTMGTALGRLGISAVIIEGQAQEGELYLLRIGNTGNPSLIPADEYKGMRTYALVESLLQAYGKKTSIMGIGPAGELGLKAASIQGTDIDGRPCRAAGRGGLGAVMGSKGLKALVVDQGGKEPVFIADPAAFKEASRVLARTIRSIPHSGQVLPKYGTAGLLGPVNALGAFPSYNARKGVFEEWEKISGETLAQTIKERGGNPSHRGCSQCIIHCSNEYVDTQGKYVTSSLEYETLWSMGGMIGVGDLDAIARLDYLCDDIGVDTISTGVAIAVAMDAGYKTFGDSRAAAEIVEEIAQGTEIGKIFGHGPVAVGRHFNNPRVPVVKGQSISAYDPRALQGNAVTYATTPMGADHTAGNLVGPSMAGKLNPLSAEGQVEASRNAQIRVAAMDATGLCVFVLGAVNTPEGEEALLRLLKAKNGLDPGADWLDETGKRILRAEKDFNRRAGFTEKDDRLPGYFYKEPLPPHNTVVLISDEEMDGALSF
ncbi:MAG: aldehyde ferredoxin oxidoreductase C-terminal domain-containing protein [Thermodesulfobacteriota bacterium]